MTTRRCVAVIKHWAPSLGMALLFTGPALAADDVSVLRDLTAVIALHALPCGQVVRVVRQGESDCIASCGDGNRYRVFVNSEGRVVALKQ
jgi:hypothetical protein